MASMRDIKRRIKSVNSTQQITKAMNLVASSKLQKARSRLDDTRPFFSQIRKVIANIVNGSNGITHPFIEVREVKKTAVIVVTGDRGLCGGYNINVSKEALNAVNKAKDASVITIGGKGKEYFTRRKVNIIESFTGISENPSYQDALEIGNIVLDLFTQEKIDEVYMAYTEFKSTISHEPKLIKLLPVDIKEFKTDDTKKSSALTLYEPSEEDVLEYVIPKYINTVIYGGMVESAVCELGARMTAMDSATDNATEMISDLTLLYNRARQGAITQEITEIVSGSNALE